MIEIHSNKDKNIIFEVQVSGINPKELSGHLRLTIDGIEYGFPAEITENSISVDVPALRSIVNRPLRSGEKIKAKLELVGNDTYIPCWDDHVTVKSAVTVEAKVINEEVTEKKKPIVKVIEKENSKPVKPKSIIKESKLTKKPVKKNVQITKEHLMQYMERHGTKNKRIQEILLKRCSDKVGDNNKLLFRELYNYYKIGKE